MKKVLSLTCAAALAVGSLAVTAPAALAKGKHHHHHHHHHGMQMPQHAMGCGPNHAAELAIVGLALGAVTGGVGSAVAYGSAYAVGGAAIGGGAGLLLGGAHGHRCY